jgi:hypothetical protein
MRHDRLLQLDYNVINTVVLAKLMGADGRGQLPTSIGTEVTKTLPNARALGII